MKDTLHFAAENFEAVATRVGTGDDDSYWIVVVPSCSPHTLRLWWGCPTSEVQVWSGEWKPLRKYDSLAEADAQTLALAISLVYSVPGVRPLSEREGHINELERKGFIDPDIADQLRAEGPPGYVTTRNYPDGAYGTIDLTKDPEAPKP